MRTLLLLLLSSFLHAQSTPFFDAIQWRCIGPHRGGRTVGAVGVPQQPGTFYIGVNNGGVWKTTDFGRVWTPIFDDQPTGSIGDVAVAPSNPDILYVASGEGLQRPDLSVGNGVYRSSNGGKTWTHTGLKDGLQIGGLAIDPTNPDRVFAAVLGHPYGPNPERGVYRTLNGGKTWEQVKFIDENTGAIQVTIDPSDPNVVYADFWANRLAPWENGTFSGPNSGLWKSIDGGNTWKKLTNGLPSPALGLGRIGFCICPSMPSRLYATVDCAKQFAFAKNYGGIYRSDDAGENWYQIHEDERLWGRGSDFAEIKADPKNPDIVYSANVAAWRSTDGGKTWFCFRGAPGGDDYHRIWINPTDPKIMLLASDQGATITVNGGTTFSSWYNQPTAQFYHVSTDNAFPYNVYGGQQESGSAGVSSRGNDGQVTFREWHPVGVDEYGYVAPDPLDPNIIYGGRVTRHDKRTGQTQNIRPEALSSGKYRVLRTAPVIFSPVDPHCLYFATNVLFKTKNGGHFWEEISPDLSRETWDVPSCVGVFTPEAEKTKRRRGVIYALAPSQQDTNTIWAGTDDGLIHITRDGGKKWTDITPPTLTVWSKVSQLDAGHFDNQTCYAAINRIRLDDLRPHIWRTHDGGKTWKEITRGLPENEPINTVREDPKQKGLLYAGSENAVYVSFDDGENWHSLRLNMPATSIRDLVVKDDDLVVGTHGRSFWILDNITPLRQHAAGRKSENGVLLYTPQTAYRVRWNMNTDTPLPQEEPAGQNPPDGAMIDYVLEEDVKDIRLEILDSNGSIVRSYRPDDPAPEVSSVNFPLYWIRPFQVLSGKKGAHRFCWDMHYDSYKQELRDFSAGFPISAVYGETAPEASAPWVMPGEYTVRLSANGKEFSRKFEVKMDPRVSTSLDQLQLQHDLSLEVAGKSFAMQGMAKRIMRTIIWLDVYKFGSNDAESESVGTLQNKLDQLNKKTLEIAGRTLNLFQMLQESDMPPTKQMVQSAADLEKPFEETTAEFQLLYRNESSLISKAEKYFDQTKGNDRFIPYKHPAPGAEGYNLLFQPDLSNAKYPKDIWSINENGELTATEDQCIFTQKTYKNFVLDLEFKTAEGTNSGVIVHCSDTNNWIPNSVEIQIADDYSKEWSKADPTWQCGAIFGHLAAEKKAVKHPGEWNRYTIYCMDRQIWVVLNGLMVTHMDMSRWISGDQNPDGSAIPSWLSRPFATLPLEGHIGFQGKHAGAPIWFRNIRIRELW
ncbi:MAG: DUF1080 domain-containing protein [Chitinophagales bacterium]|nr:DUF1080 domain-containing protein [Chitinophagales bacterium]